MVIMLMFSIGLVVMHFAFNEIFPEMQAMASQINGSFNSSINYVYEEAENATNIFDYVFVLVFVAGLMGIIVTSFLIRVHPLFLVALIIVGIIAVLISFPLSNAYEAFEDDAPAAMQDSFDAFPMTSHIMNNLPYYTIALVLTAGVILFSKRRTYEV